ncbi:Ubiquitin carboxyl-terminal hydrolase 10 [Pelomyxa schiedti]|nr:Ubiquitin carboxyl-terminal hydrolase 10 [Pelomyxa schiedti]
MKAGEVWFLISCTWFNHWKRYVRYQQRPSYSEFEGKPGPIDNAVLIEQNGDLNRFATERTDYELINGIVWKTLKGWYSGGPDIPRAVISTPGPYEDDSLSVEVRPLTLGIVKSSDDEDKMVAQFSKMDTVGNLKKTMCERMGLEPDNVHVWDYFGGAWQRHLCDEEQTLASAQIMTNQLVMLDEKSDAGSWPSHKQGYQYSRI